MYTDVMIDLETTGVSPDENAVLQIAGLRFNIETRGIDFKGMFNRSMLIPPKRFWDESTREWWWEKLDTFQAIMKDAQPAEQVMPNFVKWTNEYPCRFWSKPSHFDFQFVQSYCKQFGFAMPYRHNEARDLRSFIAGLYHPRSVPNLHVEFVGGDAHDAIWDSLHQIQVLYAHLDDVKKPVKNIMIEGEVVA